MEDKKETERKKSGRPKKAVKRERMLGFYASFTEYNAIKAKAESAGLKLADYLRQCALKGKVSRKPTPEELQLFRDLVGIANNLNQLTKLAQQHKEIAMHTKLVRTLDEINKAISSLKE